MRTITALLCSLLLCAAALGCRNAQALNEREAATEELAKALKADVKPNKVLVISNPFSQKKSRSANAAQFESAGIEGLERGFGSDIEVRVAFPKLKPGAETDPQQYLDSSSKTPLSFLVADTAFDELIRENADCELVVSLIGLPANNQAFTAWKAPKPAVGLLMPDWRTVGAPAEIINAFESGKLRAAIIADADVSQKKHFVLVAKNNVRDLLSRRPELFKP